MNDGVVSTDLDLVERCVVEALLHHPLSRRNADAASCVLVTVHICRQFPMDGMPTSPDSLA